MSEATEEKEQQKEEEEAIKGLQDQGKVRDQTAPQSAAGGRK